MTLRGRLRLSAPPRSARVLIALTSTGLVEFDNPLLNAQSTCRCALPNHERSQSGLPRERQYRHSTEGEVEKKMRAHRTGVKPSIQVPTFGVWSRREAPLGVWE